MGRVATLEAMLHAKAEKEQDDAEELAKRQIHDVMRSVCGAPHGLVLDSSWKRAIVLHIIGLRMDDNDRTHWTEVREHGIAQRERALTEEFLRGVDRLREYFEEAEQGE